jgi:hypothetical protein
MMRVVQIRRRLIYFVLGMSTTATGISAGFPELSAEHRITFLTVASLLAGLLSAMSVPQASNGGEQSQERLSAYVRRVRPVVRVAVSVLGVALFELLFLPYPMAWFPYH